MELPPREPGDILLPTGELTDIRRRLRNLPAGRDLSAVIACAFDHRTRMLPFIGPDMHMVPAGPRAVASTLLESGIEKVRIVLQQWNRRFRPTAMRLDGRLPDLFCLSAMSLHTAPAREMLRDLRRIDPDRRPLVLAGGSVCIYEPWLLFSDDPADPFGPDVAVTGEEYVLCQLMEVLLSLRSGGESLRQTFLRAKRSGLLDDIPGLMYPVGDGPIPEALVDTGIQRLCGNLDEQPSPAPGFAVLEPPSRSTGLASRPIPPERVARRSPLGCLVLTLGCKFRCPYCAIPAYNQRQYRTKSPQRIIEDIDRLYRQYGIRFYFGADDNFFNDKERTIAMCEHFVSAEVAGKPFRKRARLATEVTVHDTLAMADYLPTVRKAGVRALWLGVEDLSGKLVKKGQTPDTTHRAFQLLNRNGIKPNPMMMHHDGQPLLTPGRADGLINQVHLLARADSATLQVLMITPSAGSKLYRPTFRSGMVIRSAGGRPLEPRMYDGNHVIASSDPEPWRKQLNILLAYLLFYNPVRLLVKLGRIFNRRYLFDVAAQLWGMWGLAHNVWRTAGWCLRLMFGRIVRYRRPPEPTLPTRSPAGEPASHALPEPEPAQS
jgi:radical SAM superfamily enzyme YgiQ (UPF0313 family)